MQTDTFNWNNFDAYKSWRRKLSGANRPVSDVHMEIVKTLGGNKNIKKLRIYSILIDSSLGNCIEREEENIILLKRSYSLCFDKYEEYTVAETYVDEIDKLVFEKVCEDSTGTYYVILVEELDGSYWKYEIIV